ncbi:MAG: ABC transporter permease subunit, partial [Desulfobacterales bacterium]|nr:ABC transporter permease subunit [Desulfobacterales bacterium]
AGARATFKSYPKEVRETTDLLGASRVKYFFKVALPLASPAIIGGLFLVFMEVLNDYGAAKYYGINTFTTGIFRTWTALEDLQSAIYLSAILVLLVFLLHKLTQWYRGRKSFTLNVRASSSPHPKKPLKGRKKVLYLSIVWGTLLFAFILPVFQLVYWAVLTFDNIFEVHLFSLAMQSLGVAALAALLILIVALFLIYFSRWNKLKSTRVFSKIATLGYVLPGAIIGIGIIRSSQSVIDFASNTFNLKIGYLFYGSSAVLIYAYVFRFMAVAYNLIEANSLKIGKNLAESAYVSGAGKFRTLFSVEMPLLKRVLASAFLLVLIDIMKELPLTLILKPYHLQTLAVKAYAYADDELVAQAAL